MLRARILALLWAAAVSSGCAYNDHFDNRTARFDIAAAQSRDTMILTNIIRASHAEPLSFVQLGQISGANTAQATMGLPSMIFGPHITAATSVANSILQSEKIFGANPLGGSGYTGNSANISGSTNFQVTPQESKEFYRGLLSEVEPRTLEFFTQQGVAREILFYLFTDRLIEERNGKKQEYRNDPLDPNFRTFQQYVELAMNYGLSSEPVPNAGARGKTKRSEATEWRLCFSDLHRAPGVPPAHNSPMCSSHAASSDGRVVTFTDATGALIRLRILPRSAFAIFQYLGRIVAAGERGRIKLTSAEAIGQAPLSDDTLFQIDQAFVGPCFLSTLYEGRPYCVPQEGAANTKRILGLLTQLIALNTSIADIPVSPTVRVLQ